jgi:RNA polymerase sigma-70 factor (ECF subfamily)
MHGCDGRLRTALQCWIPRRILATTTTRLAINVAQSVYSRRETYIGQPVDTRADPALGAEQGEALQVAVLLPLEKLSPTERAAYVQLYERIVG